MRNIYSFGCIIILLFLLSSTGKVNAQDIEWQQVLGGINSEYLYDIKATPDYGFLLIGSSFSGKTGNKSEQGQGNLDYFLWKMDESGKQEWQKSFGGSGNDFLYSAELTRDGGFILGGSSDSPRSGDKKEDGFGNFDFWIIKLNAEGEEEWQKILGGAGNDQLLSVQQTIDGGYILGGSSDSSPLGDLEDKSSGNKTEESRGSYDYWIVKLGATGEIEWEKTYGGKFRDQLKSIVITDEGYLIGGTSNSTVSGDKTAKNLGESDFWVIKISEKGEEIWQKTYGGEGHDELVKILKTENGYLLAGSSDSNSSDTKQSESGEGLDFWVLEIDKDGNHLWDKAYDFGKADKLVAAELGRDGEYILGGYTQKNAFSKSNQNITDYTAVKINQRGEMLWSRQLGGDGNDMLKGLTQTRDGGYLLAGNSDSKKSDDKDRGAIGGNDYWIVKLGKDGNLEDKRKNIEVYPNPTTQYVNIVITRDFKEAEAQIFDMNGRQLQTKELPYRSTAVNLQSYPPGVYIFKIIIDGEAESVKIVKKGNQ